MPGAPPPRMNDAGMATMHGGQRPPQPVRVERHQHEMHMVGHQAPGPHLDVGLAAVLRQEIAVERIILPAEEGARAAVAALRDMVRDTGDDDAGETTHVSIMRNGELQSQLVHCHRNSQLGCYLHLS
jgi:hypothetical protein